LYEDKFSEWILWGNRNKLNDLQYPGVYAIAHSEVSLAGNIFSWVDEIIYIGMTNSISGLKGRLKQFDNTIIGKTGHGGADRVRYKYRDYDKFIEKLYVSVSPFECDVKSHRPSDLRIMGDVAKFEYLCSAHYVDIFGMFPEFNDKKRSPKYSNEMRKQKNKKDNQLLQ